MFYIKGLMFWGQGVWETFSPCQRYPAPTTPWAAWEWPSLLEINI